jgi:hypothetical protein
MSNVYAEELDQPDADVVYTQIYNGYEGQSVIQGAARARAASPTSTPATSLSEIELRAPLSPAWRTRLP